MICKWNLHLIVHYKVWGLDHCLPNLNNSPIIIFYSALYYPFPELVKLPGRWRNFVDIEGEFNIMTLCNSPFSSLDGETKAKLGRLS